MELARNLQNSNNLEQTIELSLIVPIYKDATLAESLANEFSNVMSSHYFKEDLNIHQLKNLVELVFVHDGSGIEQLKILKECADKFDFVYLIDLSRNFGQHIALSCGYSFARGNWVAIADVDQQDPIREIPKLIEFAKNQEFDLVTGLRSTRKDSLITKVYAKLFHFILNKLSGYEIHLDAATMRVMNRRFIDSYNLLTEKSRFIPGLEQWLGFRHGYFTIEHRARNSGKSSYNFTKKLIMAIDSIISFSDTPLRLAVMAGTIIAFIGFISTLVLIVLRVFVINYLPGYVSLVSLIVLLSGVQIMFVGLLSIYVGRILREVQNRPLYVVREVYSSLDRSCKNKSL